MTKRRLDGIQLVRLLSAALVLVFHSVFLSLQAYGATEYPQVFNLGALGVYLFFVISGYVIALQADEKPALFAMRRLLRIYPPYLAALVISGGVLLATGVMTRSSINYLDISLALLPGGKIQGWTGLPYWTLIYEVYFYAVAFTLMCLGGRAYDIGLVLWSLIILYCSIDFHHPADMKVGIEVVYSPLTIFFLGGAGLARLHAGKPLPAVCMAIAVGIFAWCVRSFPVLWNVCITLGAVGLIDFAVRASPLIGHVGWLSPFVRGGDYSYGLYLLHLMPILVLCHFASVIPGGVMVLIVLTMIAGSLVGLSFGKLEAYAQRMIFRPLAGAIANEREHRAIRA